MHLSAGNFDSEMNPVRSTLPSFFSIFILILLIMSSGCSTPYNVSDPITPRYRAVFVDQFKYILPDDKRIEKLLDWTQKENFNALLLYDLNILLKGHKHHDRLEEFMYASKQKGIHDVAAIGMYAKPIINGLKAYQSTLETDASPIFHNLFLELEWWNRHATWDEYKNELSQLYEFKMKQEIGHRPDISTYIGWLHKDEREALRQASFLTTYSDVIYIHAYQPKPQLSYILPRLRMLYLASRKLSPEKRPRTVLMISIEPEFSGRLVRSVTYDQIFTHLIRSIQELQQSKQLPPDFLSVLKIQGYAVFAQSFAR